MRALVIGAVSALVLGCAQKRAYYTPISPLKMITMFVAFVGSVHHEECIMRSASRVYAAER
jgi:hypothetical protein